MFGGHIRTQERVFERYPKYYEEIKKLPKIKSISEINRNPCDYKRKERIKKKIKVPCFFCGSKEKLIEHHISYYPEEIEVFCYSCHMKLHQIIERYHTQISKKDRNIFEMSSKLKRILKILENDYNKISRDKLIRESQNVPKIVLNKKFSKKVEKNVPLQLNSEKEGLKTKKVFNTMEENEETKQEETPEEKPQTEEETSG